MYQASDVERLCSGPSWASARILATAQCQRRGRKEALGVTTATSSACISDSAFSNQNCMPISRKRFCRPLIACSPVELTDAEAAVSDERAHAELQGQSCGGSVVGFRRRQVRGVAM